MTPRHLFTPLALALASLSPTAHAADTVFELGRIDISGARSDARTVLTSVDVVGGDRLQDASVLETWGLMRRVPGIQLTEFNQGTTSGKLSMRGFNGEGEVNAVKLLIDGIPSNSNDGNMPWIDAIWPLEIGRLTTVRGTNDPRFGQHQIAGHVEIDTRPGGNYLSHRIGADTLGQRDVQIAWGRDSGDWRSQLFVGWRTGQGQRDHSDSQRQVVAGQLFYQPEGRDWRIGVTARQHEADAQEPGYLTLAQSRQDPEQSPAHVATDGGTRTLRQFSLRADGQPAAGLDWQLLAWRNEFDDARFVTFSAAVSQQERDTQETHHGLRASLRWSPAISGLHRLQLEAGGDIELQDDASLRYLTRERARQSTTRDQAWTQRTRGLYLQALVEPTPTLRLVPALRVDRLAGGFSNQLTGKDYLINDYGTISQPKLSAVWAPLAGHSLYANWGRSFQVGVGAAMFKIGRVDDLAPSINTGWEAGWKFALPAVNGRLALWQQTATNEVMRKLNDPSNDSENIGATRRRGVDLQLRGALAARVEGWLGLSRQQAIIVTPDSSSGAVAGNELDHVPRWLYSAGADWQAADTLQLSAWLQGQSSYELNRANSAGRFGAYALLNLAARWQVAPQWTLSAELKNLADRYSEYVWFDGTQSLHAPGAGRSLALSLQSHF
ncbi:TonB-dependent receptor [Ideonella sp. 4Y16]|uniref:TonB-dependent receptor n=1 Tax=Ideonella alba TaxID=2824118 RepID=UPI001B361A4A|nr:TonB-dependent receptor [Ideonella alba]MBQ0942903.1 TonB-dependent receptor [Ideonella alba]